jgi:peptidyl-prolyl cis-trans isomerase D
MLQSLNSGMNSKILRGFFGILLLSALLGLVMTDVGGFFRSGGFGRTDIAKVGKTELTVPQFDSLYRRQLQIANITPDQARQVGLPNMILQQEVTRQVILQAANRVGISVGNAYVAQNLKTQLKSIPLPGDDKEKLQAVLRNMGVSENDLVDGIRTDTATKILSSTISDQPRPIPDIMTKAVAAAATQQRQAEIITLHTADLPAINTPDDKALQSYLDENKERYEIPEQRAIVLATVKQSSIIPDITIADSDIDNYYKSNQEQFKVAARAKFTQVILPDEKAATALYNAAKTSTLVKASEQAKARLIDSDWYDQGTLPDTLDLAIFDAKTKGTAALLAPVHSPLGWHVIQTEAYQDASIKPVTEAKPVITDLLRQEKTDAMLNDITEEIEQEAADGVEVSKIIEPYKGLTQELQGLTKANAMQNITALNLPQDSVNNVLDAVFTLNESDVSPIIESKDGAYILVQIKTVTAPRLPKLAEIKDKVTADWKTNQQVLALDKKTDNIIGDYDIKKPDLKGIATKHHVAYRETGLLKGESKDLPQNVMNVLFTLSPRNDLTSVKTADGAMIVRVAKIVTQPLNQITVSTKQSEDMHAALTQELQQQFVTGWRDYLGVNINQELLAKTYMQESKDQE